MALSGQQALNKMSEALQAHLASHPALTGSSQEKTRQQIETGFDALNRFMKNHNVTLKQLHNDAALQDQALLYVANETEPLRGNIDWEQETNHDALEQMQLSPDVLQAADVNADAHRQALANRVHNGVVPDKSMTQMSAAERDFLAQDELREAGLLFSPNDRPLPLEYFEQTREPADGPVVHPEAEAFEEEQRIIEMGGSEAAIEAEQEQGKSRNRGIDW